MDFSHLEFSDQETAKEAPPAGPPVDAPSSYAIARRFREAGLFDTAARYYEQTVGFNDQHYQARIEWADSLVRAGKAAEADQVAYNGLDNYRQVRALYASRALALAHRGMFSEAFSLAQVGMDEEGSWYARCVQAELLLKQSRDARTKAVYLFEEAMEMAEERWEPSFLGGWALLDADLPALAAGFFAESGRYRPQAPASWLYLGDCFQALRLYEQARFYYQKVIELSPKHSLAVERQQQSAPMTYGLMRVFRRESLRERWNREFEKLTAKPEQEPNDY